MRLERDNIPLDKDFPFQISEVVLTPKNSRPGTWHWHSYFEITCVLEGKGNYFVNGQEYTMEKDDVIIFNNVEPHGWNLIGDDMKLLVMIFSPEFIAEKISVFDTEYLKPFVERGSNFKNRVGREDEINADIRAGIWEIYKEWNDQKEGYPLMIKANVLRILTMLIRTYQDETKSGEMLKEKKNAMKRLEQAFDYIDAHYCEKITLEELKEYPCLSFEQGGNNSFYFAEEVLSTYEYKRLIKADDRATMLNLMVGLGGYTLCSGIICEDLNGSDYCAVKLDSDEIMTIGYIARKGVNISALGKKYLEEISRYKDKALK